MNRNRYLVLGRPFSGRGFLIFIIISEIMFIRVIRCISKFLGLRWFIDRFDEKESLLFAAMALVPFLIAIPTKLSNLYKVLIAHLVLLASALWLVDFGLMCLHLMVPL